MTGYDFAAIQEALAAGPQACRYHGTDFAFLGTEPYSAAGLPRCDSCKHPWMVRRALDALDRVVREHDARPPLHTEHGLVFDGDVTDVRQSQQTDPVAAEAWARQRATEWSDRGGAVAIREATPWRLESTEAKP